MLTAKPMLKMLSWGAARVMTPNAKLMSSRAMMADRAITREAWYMTPRKLTKLRMAGRLSPLSETGRVSKLSTTILTIRRWPSTARNTRVASIR
ncbi:hypothetical protein D3C76_1092060 [compost metagenome]